ncbi:hypothetical protein [Niallia sp. 03133]
MAMIALHVLSLLAKNSIVIQTNNFIDYQYLIPGFLKINADS